MQINPLSRSILSLLLLLLCICFCLAKDNETLSDQESLKAHYRSIYGKYLDSYSKKPSVNQTQEYSSTKNASSYGEFKPPTKNRMFEFEKFLTRVQRDIAIRKRSVESVADTDENDKTMNGSKTHSKKVIVDALEYENRSSRSNRSKYSGINEFPSDFMSDKIRQNGGFIVHILIFVYLSLALAYICDSYFLKSLEFICEVLSLPSDVAGATFMAIGTSAPELFTSIIGVFISDNDIGTGTIVGSAVFNLLVIPGACGFAAYKNLDVMPKISPFPILRDTLFYILTIITLILCLKDNQVDWIESTTLLGLYAIYIVVMYFNTQISNILNRKKKQWSLSSSSSGSSLVSPKRKKCNQCQKNKRNVSLISSISNSDSGVDYKTLKGESSPLLSNCNGKFNCNVPLPVYESNGHTHHENVRRSVTGSDSDIDYSRIRLEQTVEGKFKEVGTPSRSDSGGESPTSSMLNFKPDSQQRLQSMDETAEWSDNVIVRVLLFPFRVCFWLTLPRPTALCFVFTFLSSICWIAALSYIIVWMVTILAYTFGIPDTVAGITILAAGTSIPELISSYLLVKKAGLVDMALCNSIGSNIFDILFCLGLPWLIKTFVTMLSQGVSIATLAATSIPIRSTALPLTSLTLLITVAFMLGIFRLTRWRLCLETFVYCSIVYILFVVTTTVLELNI